MTDYFKYHTAGSQGALVCAHTYMPLDTCICDHCLTNKRFDSMEHRIAKLEKLSQLAKQ